MKTSIVLSLLAGAASVLAAPVVEARATTTTTATATATATPATYGAYGKYGKYGNYGNYGSYSRSAEAEAEIEALLELASTIKAKRAADVEAEAAAL